MVRKEREDRAWRAGRHAVRTGRFQRFRGPHEKDTQSPRFKSKKSDAGSSASEKGSPVSPRERSNTIGERSGIPTSIRNGISNRDRGKTFSYRTEDEYEDVLIQRFKASAKHGNSDDNAGAKEMRKQIRNGDEAKVDRYPAPLASPHKTRSEANTELGHEEAAHEESYDVPKDEGITRIRDYGSLLPRTPESDQSVDETSDQEDQAMSDLSQEPEETETLPETPSSHSEERESLDSRTQQSGSGPILIDAAPIHDPLEEPVGLGTNDEVPDATHYSPETTENVDADPIHDPIEEPVDLGINMNDEAPDSTHYSTDSKESLDAHPIHDSAEGPIDPGISMHDIAPHSTRSSGTMESANARPIHSLAEEQVDPGIPMDDEAPDGTHLLDTMEHADQDSQLMSGNGEIAFSRPRFTGSIHIRSPISQLGSPGIGHFENPRSQPIPARSDRIETPDPEPGHVTVETSPTRDEVKAWLSSPSALPKDYYNAFPESPIPLSPAGLSSSPGSHAGSIGTGSLIVSSPTLSVRLPCSK